MKDSILEHYKAERTGKPLDRILEQDAEYQKSRRQYHEIMEEMKKHLNMEDSGERGFLLKLDEIVGVYSASYGDAAYSLGFRDGMEIGLKYGDGRE